MSKALKKAGFRFCGPTISYAFMQAVGMVNDRQVPSARHCEVEGVRTGGTTEVSEFARRRPN